ncbi:MAG TPA: hypothetical protein VF867_14370, partial [Arthrobacter sp.]
MSWMSAIAIDAGCLVEDLAKAGIADPYDGLAAETARTAGWVSPTEAWLVTQLLDEIQESGSLDEKDTIKMARVRAILGAKEE